MNDSWYKNNFLTVAGEQGPRYPTPARVFSRQDSDKSEDQDLEGKASSPKSFASVRPASPSLLFGTARIHLSETLSG